MGSHHSRNDEWLLPLIKSLHRTVLRWRGQGVVASIFDTFEQDSFFAEIGESAIVRLVGVPMVSAATKARSYGVCTVFRTGERVTVGMMRRFVTLK